MELVYLWVEEYKNIKRQGFNFSPRFKCVKKDNNLVITENEGYIDIFPKNIKIATIVGENGCGKTNLIESIITLVNQLKNIESYSDYKLSLVYRSDNKWFKKSINHNLLINEEEVNELNEDNNNTFTMYFNYTLDTLKNEKTNFENLYHRKDNYETPVTILPKKNQNKIDLEDIDYHTNYSILNFTIRNNIDFSTIKDFFIPQSVELTFNKYKLISKEVDEPIYHMYGELVNNAKLFKNEEEYRKIISDAFMNSKKNRAFLPDLKYFIKSNFIRKENLEFFDKNLENYTNEDLQKITKLYLINKMELLPTYSSSIGSEIEELLEDDKKFEIAISSKSSDYGLKSKVAYNFYKEIKDSKFYFESSKIDILNNFNIIKNIPSFFNCEFFNRNNVSFNSLSYGQKFKMRFIYNLVYQLEKIKEIRKENNSQKYISINLFLDEIEQGLHPNWQREFFAFLFDVLEKYESIFTFNIICNTHSSFILSDISKENIIFLDEGKQVYPFENKQTFGANIHTLLSHGFFMKDGLLGKFAKAKIDKVIEYLNKNVLSKKELEYCENIISIIGEPVIKRQLQKMLDSKRLKKVDKIDDIEKQIAKLSQELESLKNGKN